MKKLQTLKGLQMGLKSMMNKSTLVKTQTVKIDSVTPMKKTSSKKKFSKNSTRSLGIKDKNKSNMSLLDVCDDEQSHAPISCADWEAMHNPESRPTQE